MATILVTGGASGIGLACAQVLAARNHRIVVLDLDLSRADGAAKSLAGAGHLAVAADVTDKAMIEATVADLETRLGPLDGLVNSAGILQKPLPPETLPDDVYDDVLRVDIKGTWVPCVAVGTRMAKRGRGAIVSIASIAGMRAMPLHPYSQSKAAIISMTASLAAEWGRSGVRVNAVSPGFTRTPALQAAIQRGERDPSALEQNSALGRLVEPDEIARTVAFLLSDEASAITGANIVVDCGWLVTGPWWTYGGLRPSRAEG
jgi:NAD(P)-dependent dehydrogenase (short-subunit alcohol dehydrogenase family)